MQDDPPPPLEREPAARRVRVLTAIAIFLASVLIVFCARGDLYNDELWSLSFARKAHSAADVFTAFKHDNNHPLNTLYLYLVGEQQRLYTYRLLAVVTGIASLLLLGFIAAREWGHREALCVVVLAGASYPLLLYFSEARGYAPAIFFALACYALLRENARRFTAWRAAVFWLCAILGTLSHATFIMAVTAFCLGDVARCFLTAAPSRRDAIRLAIHHAVPMLFFVWWYRFYVKPMEIGGGALDAKWDVFGQGAAVLLGIPESPILFGVAMVCTIVIVAAGIVRLRRDKDSQWFFFLAILLLAPVILLIVSRPVYLYFRYFIVCFPFFYLLVARTSCRCAEVIASRWRWLPYVVLAAIVAGQLPRDFELVRLGRGRFTEAIAYMAHESAGHPARVGSDHDFRNRLVFDFYAPRQREAAGLRYVEQSDWRHGLPDWFLTHSQSLSHRPQKEITIGTPSGAATYQLAREFKYSGVSGWSWFVYRRKG